MRTILVLRSCALTIFTGVPSGRVLLDVSCHFSYLRRQRDQKYEALNWACVVKRRLVQAARLSRFVVIPTAIVYADGMIVCVLSSDPDEGAETIS